MIPRLEKRNASMLCGFGGGGVSRISQSLYKYIEVKDISKDDFDLTEVIGNLIGVEIHEGKFEFNNNRFFKTKYHIESQEKWEKYGGYEPGEKFLALCKRKKPLLVSRFYHLVFEDSVDDFKYNDGPSGCELYLFAEDKFAREIYESINRKSR